MSRTTTVRTRIEPELKSEVEELLTQLGVTTAEAITMFFSQIRLRQGLPFPVEMPNDTTRRTFEATDSGNKLHAYSTVDEMFKTGDR